MIVGAMVSLKSLLGRYRGDDYSPKGIRSATMKYARCRQSDASTIVLWCNTIVTMPRAHRWRGIPLPFEPSVTYQVPFKFDQMFALPHGRKSSQQAFVTGGTGYVGTHLS